MTVKRNSTDIEHQRERTLVRSPYAKCLEPTLEFCMKIQRSIGVNGRIRRMHMH